MRKTEGERPIFSRVAGCVEFAKNEALFGICFNFIWTKLHTLANPWNKAYFFECLGSLHAAETTNEEGSKNSEGHHNEFCS
jgi:hypothetical protein